MAKVEVSQARTLSKNTLVLVSGQMVSNLLRVVYLGVLARYVGPEGIGVLSTATSLVSIAVLVVNFGLGTVLVRDISADHKRAASYVTNSALTRLLLSALMSIILLGAASQSSYPAQTQLIIGIYAVAYILDALSDVAYCVFRSFQRMEYPAAIDLGRDLLNVVFSLVGIWLGWPLVLIVVVSLAASLVKLVLSALSLRSRFVRPSLAIDLLLCRTLMLNAVPFALLLSISVIYDRLNLIILSLVSSAESVGIYSAATTPIAILLLVPTAFMDSVFPLFSRYFRASSADTAGDRPGQAPLASAYQFSYKALLVIGFATGAGTILVSGLILPIIYGEGFERAIPILNLLAVQIFAMVGYVNGAFLNATNRQRLFVILRGAMLALYVLLCILLIPTYGYLGAASAAVIPTALDFLLYTGLCHYFAGLRFPAWLILRTALSAGAMFLATRFALGLTPFWPLAVVFVAPITYLVALVALGVVKTEEVRLLRQMVAKNSVG